MLDHVALHIVVSVLLSTLSLVELNDLVNCAANKQYFLYVQFYNSTIMVELESFVYCLSSYKL